MSGGLSSYVPPGTTVPAEPYETDFAPWTEDDYQSRGWLFEMVLFARRLADLTARTADTHPDYPFIASSLQRTRARIAARLESLAPTDRQRKHPH